MRPSASLTGWPICRWAPSNDSSCAIVSPCSSHSASPPEQKPLPAPVSTTLGGVCTSPYEGLTCRQRSGRREASGERAVRAVEHIEREGEPRLFYQEWGVQGVNASPLLNHWLLSACNIVGADVDILERVLNLIDTPGYPDFVGDVHAALRVADLAVFVVSADILMLKALSMDVLHVSETVITVTLIIRTMLTVHSNADGPS